MIHKHSHSHTDKEPPHNSAFFTAVFFNTLFVILQIFYSLKSGSMSLLSDAVHNAGDVFGLVLAWGASWLMTLSPRKRYSYGYRRTTIFAVLVNALLLTGSAAVIVFESVSRLLQPQVVNSSIVIGVAMAGILVNGGTALFFMQNAGDDLNIRGAFLHLASDALISAGVVISAILVHFTHYLWIDPLTGLLIVIIIFWGTIGLLRDSVSLVLDAIPRHIDSHAITDYLRNLPGVTDMHDLHIWGLSTREVALTVHLVMTEKKLTEFDFQAAGSHLREHFHIHHTTLQIEPGEISCHMMNSC